MSDTRMTKVELVREVAQKAGLTHAQIQEVLAALTDVVTTTVASGRQVVLPGLAKVEMTDTKPTKERKGVNPFTKQPMVIKARPAGKRVAIRPVPTFKAALKK